MEPGLNYLLKGFVITLAILLFVLSFVGALFSIMPGLYILLGGIIIIGLGISKKSFMWKIVKKIPILRSIFKKVNAFKNEDHRMRVFAFLTIRTLTIFLIVAFLLKSYEFVFYGIMFLIIFSIVYIVHRKIHLHLHVFVSLCMLFMVHVTGGVLMLRGINIYEKGIGFLNYGHFVHFLGTFVAVFIIYNLLHYYFTEKTKSSEILLFISLVALTMGFLGLLNLIEWGASGIFNFTPNMGGYFSTKIDLIGNLIVASLASFFVIAYHRARFFKKFMKGWNLFR